MALQIDAVTGEMRDVPDIDMNAPQDQLYAEIRRRAQEAEARRAGTMAVRTQDAAVGQANDLGLQQVTIGGSPAPAPGPAPAPPQAPAPVVPVAPGSNKVTRVNRGSSHGEQSVQISDEEREATKQAQYQAGLDARMAQNRSDQLGTIQQLAAVEEREMLQERQRRIDAVMEDANKKIDAEGARRAELEKQLDGMQVTDFFKDKDGNTRTGALIMSAIARGLGAFASGMTGMPNFANQIIESKIEQHFARQRSNIQNMKDKVAMARTREQDAVAAKRRMLEDVAITEAVAREKIANKASAMMARAGLTPEQIQQQEVVSSNLKRASDLRLALAQATRKRVTDQAEKQVSIGDQQTFGVPGLTPQALQGGVDPNDAVAMISNMKLSGPQAEAAGSTLAMANNLQIISQYDHVTATALEKVQKNAAKSGLLQGSKGAQAIMSLIGVNKNLYQGLTDDERKAMLAWKNSEVNARKVMTGAGVTAVEMEDYAQLLTPQFGDTPAAIEQKRANMKQFIITRSVQAGPAARVIQAAANGAFNQRPGPAPAAPAAPAAPKPQGRRFTTKDGKTGTLMPDGTFFPDY